MNVVSNLLTPISEVKSVSEYLNNNHYLGAARRGFAWSDEFGVMVLSKPTSRKLPHQTWLELSRWCLTGEPNAGSRQWSRVHKWLMSEMLDITTIVSYSDPSVGHTGSLYRACNWIWAPTWMRLRPPPSAGGSWDGKTIQAVKDRWVFPLRRDEMRENILSIRDASVRKKYPDAEYREPRWRGNRWSLS